MTVVCSGSIAYDYILTFKGRFKDHILLDKTHILNLSFLVDDLKKRRGGVAGNYAYNLALLGYPSAVLATAGTDATEYRDWLAARGVDCRGLRLLEGEISATGFTTTDMDDNQLTGYYGGAMWKAGMVGLDDAPLVREGSRIATRRETVEIPAAPSVRESDPTGCGDAYRAGLVAGLLRGLDLDAAGRVASLAATYAVEQVGTIEHEYTRAEFARRYKESFKTELPEKFWG